jgi:NADH dehydrogenase (ubiquinone) 1 alpha subcomplex subunit 13
MSATKYMQDGPPPGGYPSVRFKRSLPDAGPTAAIVWGTAAVFMAWGLWKVGQQNKLRRSQAQEKRESRLALIPLLQAEEDIKAAAIRAKMSPNGAPSVYSAHKW